MLAYCDPRFPRAEPWCTHCSQENALPVRSGKSAYAKSVTNFRTSSIIEVTSESWNEFALP